MQMLDLLIRHIHVLLQSFCDLSEALILLLRECYLSFEFLAYLKFAFQVLLNWVFEKAKLNLLLFHFADLVLELRDDLIKALLLGQTDFNTLTQSLDCLISLTNYLTLMLHFGDIFIDLELVSFDLPLEFSKPVLELSGQVLNLSLKLILQLHDLLLLVLISTFKLSLMSLFYLLHFFILSGLQCQQALLDLADSLSVIFMLFWQLVHLLLQVDVQFPLHQQLLCEPLTRLVCCRLLE